MHTNISIKHLSYLILIICFGCQKPTSTADSKEVDKVELTPSKEEKKTVQNQPQPILDTINTIILKKKEDIKIYNGEVRDELFIYNGVYTYGHRSDWEKLRPIPEAEYESLKSDRAITAFDTIDLPIKTNGVLKLSPEISFLDDSLEENLGIYNVITYFFNKKVLIFSKQELHNRKYYALTLSSNNLDSLAGEPIQSGDYLVSGDLEITTDSQHFVSIHEFKNGQLHLKKYFSSNYLFGITPEEIFLKNDSLLIFRERGGINYWELSYNELTNFNLQ